MHRIGRDKSIVNWIPCSPNDTIILAYGEVDCRGHIGKQIDLGRQEEDVITELTSEYIDTIRRVVTGHVVVVAVIPPTTHAEYRAENPDGGFPFVSSDADRVRYTKKVNQSLAVLCKQNGFVLFDPYGPYTREDGCLRRELSDGNVHVGDTRHVLSQFRPAVVIPLWPGDYARFQLFRASLPAVREFDVVVVLTYREDTATFDRSSVDVVLVLEDGLSREALNVVATKKLHAITKTYYALETLRTRYTYFACVDCDVVMKTCTSLFARIAKRYAEGRIVGGTVDSDLTDFVRRINQGSAVYFPDDDLSSRTNAFRFYSWFSDVPLYRSDTLEEFLRVIGFEDKSSWLAKTTVNFHWIPYSYYLLLYRNASIFDVKTVGIQRNWSLEVMPEQTLQKVAAAGFTPLWIPNAIYKPSMTSYIMAYHCDRNVHFFGHD
jgi:hypothetical protein